MNYLNDLLDIAETLDEKGLKKEASILDDFVDNYVKNSSQKNKDLHKCGLKESTVDDHITLLNGYKKAIENLDLERAKVMKSKNEKDSPNFGKLRDIASSYAYNHNAIILHEMYFSDVVNNNPYSIEKDEQMSLFLKELYGDYNSFSQELYRLSLIPRNGWVVFSYCVYNKKLIFNVIDSHDQNILISSIPVLALDMWEHAYFSDFGLNKEEYVKWFLNRIDWRLVKKRIKSIRIK
jgi:Fe-Mn family superoxide dismutase